MKKRSFYFFIIFLFLFFPFYLFSMQNVKTPLLKNEILTNIPSNNVFTLMSSYQTGKIHIIDTEVAITMSGYFKHKNLDYLDYIVVPFPDKIIKEIVLLMKEGYNLLKESYNFYNELEECEKVYSSLGKFFNSKKSKDEFKLFLNALNFLGASILFNTVVFTLKSSINNLDLLIILIDEERRKLGLL